MAKGGGKDKTKKKKGPKGKKDRAKAKLDRQWGEELILPKKGGGLDTKQQQKKYEKYSRKNNSSSLKTTTPTTDSRSKGQKEKDDLLLNQYHQSTNYISNNDDHDDNTDTDESSMNSNETKDGSGSGEKSFISLLHCIKTKQQLKQKHQKSKSKQYHHNDDIPTSSTTNQIVLGMDLDDHDSTNHSSSSDDSDNDVCDEKNDGNHANHQNSGTMIHSSNSTFYQEIIGSIVARDTYFERFTYQLLLPVPQQSKSTFGGGGCVQPLLSNLGTTNDEMIKIEKTFPLLLPKIFGMNQQQNQDDNDHSGTSTDVHVSRTLAEQILPSFFFSKKKNDNQIEHDPYQQRHYFQQLSQAYMSLSSTTPLSTSSSASSSHVVRELLKRRQHEIRQIITTTTTETQTKKKKNTQQKQKSKILDSYQSFLLPFLVHYPDMLLTNITTKPYRDSYQHIMALHIVNHILTSRTRIYKHNKKIQEMEKNDENMNNNSKNNTKKNKKNQVQPSTKNEEKNDDNQNKTTLKNVDDDDDTWRRDQGYSRPTVLILVPTRKVCYEFVHKIIDLLSVGSTNENPDNNNIVDDSNQVDRFEMEYGPPPLIDEVDEKKRLRRQQVLQEKGQDWNELFGDESNDDDDFKLGIAFVPHNNNNNSNNTNTKMNQKKNDGNDPLSSDPSSNPNSGTSSSCTLKLFTDFYKSDIILASPLALKILTTASAEKGMDDDDSDGGGDNKSSTPNGGPYDFLSSIEICCILRADVLLMQNWDHVNDVLELVNQLPQRLTNQTDLSRVRTYLLNGQGKYYRQLIMSSSFLDPCLVATFKQYGCSWNGSIKIRSKYSMESASISNVILPGQQQVFQRIPCTSFQNHPKDRMKYFQDVIVPQLTRHQQKHTLMYIPSYFDYVSIRNVLLSKKDVIDFVSITEYTNPGDVTRHRTYFLRGDVPLLLYTGRAHYFLRHKIKGMKHLIYFGVPEHESFYSDHINRLHDTFYNKSTAANDEDDDDDISSISSTCLMLYSIYESHALERIVGTKTCTRMIKGEQSTHVFLS